MVSKNCQKNQLSAVIEDCQKIEVTRSQKNAKKSKVCGHRTKPKYQKSAITKNAKSQWFAIIKNAKKSKVCSHRKMSKTQRFAIRE